MSDCSYFDNCKNNSRCYLCNNQLMYKPLHKQYAPKRKVDSQKSGMAFQRQVVGRYNDRMNKVARETPNSGAIWTQPGDVVTPDFLIECKQRGVTAKGKTQMTITKEQLEKIREEAGLVRPPLFVFGFKEDDQIYAVTDFDYLLGLIEWIDYYKARAKED